MPKVSKQDFINEYQSEYPTWAARATPANIKQPTATRIANGWVIEQPTHTFFNWHMNRTDGRLRELEARMAWLEEYTPYTECRDTAATHNSIFRGIDLKDKYTFAQLSTKIANEDWFDLYIGDYIDVTMTSTRGGTETVRWVIAGFDTYFEDGDTMSGRHHIVLVPASCFKTKAQMNGTATIVGAYAGSTMFSSVLADYANAVEAAFGASHILQHSDYLANAVNTGVASAAYPVWMGVSSGAAWTYSKLTLLNEVQVFGARVASSSMFDVGNRCMQLPLFRLAEHYKHASLGHQGTETRVSWWLSAVAGSGNFCAVDSRGAATAVVANENLGVRPYFLFY